MFPLSAPFFFSVLLTSKLLLRARLRICRRASAVVRWAPSLKSVLCDENGIGGGGEYFEDNDANLGIISVLYREASSGKYVPRAVFFDLEPGMIDAVRASSFG